MVRVLNGLKLSLSISLIIGLVFTSAVFSVLLINKIRGDGNSIFSTSASDIAAASPADKTGSVSAASGFHRKEAGKPAAETGNTASAGDGKRNPDPGRIRLNVPVISQMPELPAGCEVTSLAMLLAYYGIDRDKVELAGEIPKDSTKPRYKHGTISYWGDPNSGFVGSMNGSSIGYGVYHHPLYGLAAKYIPTAVDLSGKPFQRILHQLSQGIPVIVWTTKDFQVPVHWLTWNSPNGKVRATYNEHAVVLSGVWGHQLIVDDPLTGTVHNVNRDSFVASWKAMGSQAVSYMENK